MDPANAGATPTPQDSARRIKDAAASAAERGKSVAAQKVGAGARTMQTAGEDTASALRRAADDVTGEYGFIGQGLRKSADAIERMTRALGSGDVRNAVNEVGRFARRQPVILLSASLAAGFVVARIAKTALERSGDGAASGGLPLNDPAMRDESFDRSTGY